LRLLLLDRNASKRGSFMIKLGDNGEGPDMTFIVQGSEMFALLGTHHTTYYPRPRDFLSKAVSILLRLSRGSLVILSFAAVPSLSVTRTTGICLPVN
jgi:hypothetical protein